MDTLDEIDKRIIYRLMENARDVSAPMIAEEVNVSPGTIRNRLDRLESQGVITGHHAAVDFEAAADMLTNLYICSVPVPDREKLATEVLQIPGVVNVRELMTGGANLHVTAVGENMDDLTRTARALSALGVEIEDEELIHRERSRSYQPYGPDDDRPDEPLAQLVSLPNGAEVVELGVREGAPVAGRSIEDAVDEGLLSEHALVVAIERDGAFVTPRGDVALEPGDIVSVFSQDGEQDRLQQAFTGDPAEA